MMREDQLVHDIRATAPPEPAPVPEEKPPTTVLVYRDGRRTEIQDYAISAKLSGFSPIRQRGKFDWPILTSLPPSG